MSITDHIALLKSKETPYETLFENQSWLYINDINTSYENSTSVIETSSLSNSGKYACYNKAYLSVPLLVTLTADNVEATGVKVAIKQSFLSLVNSLTVDLNGTNIIQQNNLIDVVNHFQVLTSESATTKPRWATIGFGETVAVRQSYLNLGAEQTVLSAVELAKLHQSNVSKDIAGVKQYSVRAIIYLKDLHPFFHSVPISKALNFKIQIFWNVTSCSVTSGAAGEKTFTTARAFNGSTPLELTDIANSTAVTASVHIGNQCYNATQVTAGAIAGNVGNQVQLWVPAVQMRPDVEHDYQTSTALKTVKYLDYYQYSITGVSAGETFNKLVSNGISNLKGVLVVPFNNSNKENVSPVSDGLPMAYGHFNNFQVLVGGSNVLSNELRYSFHTFAQEFLHSHGVNGNESAGLGSGLVGFAEWFKNPYYFVDCSRIPDEIAKSYRSLQITGSNVTTLPMDIMVYAFYDRSFSLNTMNGSIEPV